MSLGWFRQVIRVIERYDPVDLMMSVAALQLLPQNAERALRLEALANAASTLPRVEDRVTISTTELRRVCNDPPLADIRSLEDPSEQAFTEAFTFHGGAYVVFPGIVDDATFILRHLARATVQDNERLPRAFVDAAVQTLGAGLALSDLVASAAGLSRGVPPDSMDSRVYVPSSSVLANLKDAVRIKYEDLEVALGVRGFDLYALEPLTTMLGGASLAECMPMDGPVAMHPLLRADDGVVLAAPGLLLAALRHRLICLGQECGILDALARRYRLAVWQTIRRRLRFLRHEPISVLFPPMPSAMPVTDGVFSMDTDKVLYVSLTTDDFREYDGGQVFGVWDQPDLSGQLEERQRTIEEFLVRASPWLNEIIVLHLVAGIGRKHRLGFGPPPPPLECPRLCMSASDLEVVALLEAGNPLMLRKYAMASTGLREHTHVLAWSGLDEFSVYRDAQYSYYLSDETKPSHITITPGTGLRLRLKALEEFDFHGVPAFEPGCYIEVARIDRTCEMPIYAPIELVTTGRRFALVVEGLPVYVWVVGPGHDEEAEQRAAGRMRVLTADLIAYWIWQFSSSLAPRLLPFRERSPALVIKLWATQSKDWLEKSEQTDYEDVSIAEFELQEDEHSILLRINPSLQRALGTQDNEGERALMAIVLRALDELVAGSEGERQFTSQDIQGIIDEHAPLGPKKKALLLDPNDNPALSTVGLPRHRGVQLADKTMVLDELGAYLTDDLGMRVGPIPKGDRTRIVREVVGHLYRRLGCLVATLDPELLLDWLISHHEAIRFGLSQLTLTIPTHLACLGGSEGFTAKLAGELQQLYEAAQAARFVIEYVSAQPPKGLRPMSGSVYDELQALAAEVILWAGIGDLIHYRIADIELSVLRSGRLGSDYEAMVARPGLGFLEAYSLEQVDRASGLFAEHWPSAEASPGRSVAEISEIDSAFGAEFGHTLTELTAVMADCFAIGTEQVSPVKRLTVDQMIGRLVQTTGHSHSKVAQMLNGLSLRSRPDFLEPPAPFRREDVYPWRFGRPLSYIRCPLVQTAEEGGAVLRWGNLHLYDSMNYVVDLCLSGRLQARATSQQMRSLLARFNQERGSVFTLRVRRVFDACRGLVVDSNLRKVGRTRIAEKGNDLGDIDVLVINPRRRRVLVAECKDLSVARNPHEMANELRSLFVGNDKQPTVVRHQRRASWIEGNLTLVLEHYGVESGRGSWQVESIVVVSEEMLTPHIHQPPVPVISFRTLEQSFVEEWI